MHHDLILYAKEAIIKYNVPAVSLAVWKNGKLSLASSGILNLDTRVEATTGSIFQIGSVTKLFTASLIMKMVEEGSLDLDAPVKHYLSDFQLADKDASHRITVKQLINHTSGIAGDYFPDDQKEDGPHIARYVDRCAQLPLVHPVGERFSYSNAAFSIAGRVIEVVSRMSWFDAMETYIFKPLGMHTAICRPAGVIRYRAALGHLIDSENSQKLLTHPSSYLSLGQSPAGTTPMMTAEDLVTFGRAHLSGGQTRFGARWLSEQSVRLMQTPSFEVPAANHSENRSIGLGWSLSEHKRSGLRFASHTGGTNGQTAHLRIFPAQNVCIAVLINAMNVNALTDIVNELTGRATGVIIGPDIRPTVASRQSVPLEVYEGCYQSYAGQYSVQLHGDTLVATYINSLNDERPYTQLLVPAGKDRFDVCSSEGNSSGLMHFFLDEKGGDLPQLFYSGRIFTRLTANTNSNVIGRGE